MQHLGDAVSRGPGKWQRLILSELECKPAFYLRRLLPPSAPRSNRIALNRAASKLHDAGKIGLYYMSPADYQNGQWIYRHGPNLPFLITHRKDISAHEAIQLLFPGFVRP